jgi:hypothetical protein
MYFVTAQAMPGHAEAWRPGCLDSGWMVALQMVWWKRCPASGEGRRQIAYTRPG